MSDETTVHFPRRLVKQFILMYKELDCLWNRDSAAYKIKMKRHQAITQLTELVQTYDPAATRVHVLRKIDSLRACVRREYKKVTDSRQVATCEEDVFVPQLWYYKLFSFLIQEEQEKNKDKVPVVRIESVQSLEQTADSSEEEVEEESEDPQSEDVKPELSYDSDFIEYTSHRSARTSNRLSPREEPLRKKTKLRGSEGQCGVDDEYDAIGINVAAKLRHLPDNMRILAEKLISDVLFQAQTNGLTSASVLMTPDPFH